MKKTKGEDVQEKLNINNIYLRKFLIVTTILLKIAGINTYTFWSFKMYLHGYNTSSMLYIYTIYVRINSVPTRYSSIITVMD